MHTEFKKINPDQNLRLRTMQCFSHSNLRGYVERTMLRERCLEAIVTVLL